ncbi:MAG: roadblock/LC7 domain-containing protein [Planctomycetota bacterium]|jgi:predicted regulator of Ras-like GTPase activity (Roadblock/LC7/MglB family)
MTDGERGDVYRLVFELTARATDVPYDEFLTELVDGLALHYRAKVCRIHVGSPLVPVATSDPNGALAGLKGKDLARYETLDAMLAEAVRRDGVLRTALDLDGGEEIVSFLGRKMTTPETFAFPLMARGSAFGAITLYLDDIYPFQEADVRGLQAVGNVLFAANNRGEDFSGQRRAAAPLDDEQRKVYEASLGNIRKILDELKFLVDARTVLLLDGQGDFVSKVGEDSKFSTTQFSSLVASGYAAGRRLAGLYGGQDLPCVTHEGESESVFVIEIKKGALLAVVCSDHDAPGLIRRWARSVVGRLGKHYDELLGATS